MTIDELIEQLQVAKKALPEEGQTLVYALVGGDALCINGSNIEWRTDSLDSSIDLLVDT